MVYPLLEKAAAGKPAFRRLSGTAIFCDVAGFTALTEALSVLGKEGSEELTRLLNAYFTSMITIIEEEGGDVLRFGGDAMAVFFPGDDGARAASASLRMMEAMPAFSAMETRAGVFSLTMKIGASAGDVLLGIVGNEDLRYDYYATGSALDFSAEAEHHAEPGLVVCHPSFLERKPDTIATVPREGEFRTLLEAGKKQRVGIQEAKAPDETHLQRMLPSYLSEYVDTGRVGEHRGTCVLFVSFSGWKNGGKEEIFDSEAHERLERCYEVFSETAVRFGGSVNKLDMGDKGSKAIMTFGVPFALENREEMAVRASLELFSRKDFPGGVVLRGGLTSGALFSGPVGSPTRREYTVMGNSINLAARLMQKADEGQLLCGGKCAKAASSTLAFKALPPVCVKGFRNEVPVFEPVGEREDESAETTTLVERKEAVEAIGACLLRDESRAVAMVGEAGMGKTALVGWAVRRAREAGTTVVRVPLGAYSRERPFGAWRGPFRALIGVDKRDSEAKLRSARDAALAAEPAGYRVLVNRLLDLPQEETPAIRNLSPKERKALTFAVLERAFAAGGQRALLFDNLHWADPVSVEFLGFILGGEATRSLRVVFSLRPGVSKTDELAGRCERVELAPLTAKGIERFLRDGLRILDLEKDVLEWFKERSKGIPSVVKALVSALDAAGLLDDSPGGRRVDRDRLFATKFPETLEGLYLAPVDRLPANEKGVLGHASVLGTSVSVNLLRVLSEMEEEKLQAALRGLEEKGLLIADTWGDRPYEIFADGLLRDAVYSTLPFSKRRENHLGLARFLEKEGKEQAKLWPTLANHFQEGGDDEKARRYARLAGRDAFQRYDNVTALRFLEIACKNVSAAPEDVDDAFSLMNVYANLGRWPEAAPVLEGLRTEQYKLDAGRRARFYSFISRDKAARGDLDGAEKTLKRVIFLAQSAQDISQIGNSYVNLVGLVYGPTGRMKEAEEALKKALALPHGPGQAVFRTLAAMNLGSVFHVTGRMKKAENSFLEAYRLAKREGLGPQGVAVATNLCLYYMKAGRFVEAATWAKSALRIGKTFALRKQVLYSESNLVLALMLDGRISEASKKLLSVKNRARLLGESSWEILSGKALGYGLFLKGNFEEGFAEMEKALLLAMELKDGLYFKDALVETSALYYALDAPGKARALWKRKDVLSTLEACPGTPSQKKPVERVRAWMKADSETILHPGFAGAKDMAPEERMERSLTAAETAWKIGDSKRAGRRLVRAQEAIAGWPEFAARIRVLRLEAFLHPRNFRLGGQVEALKLLEKNIGGTWGLRLLGAMAAMEKDVLEKKRLTRLARWRLGFVKKHSPDWAWEKICAFPEVEPLLTARLR